MYALVKPFRVSISALNGSAIPSAQMQCSSTPKHVFQSILNATQIAVGAPTLTIALLCLPEAEPARTRSPPGLSHSKVASLMITKRVPLRTFCPAQARDDLSRCSTILRTQHFPSGPGKIPFSYLKTRGSWRSMIGVLVFYGTPW